MSVQFGKCNFDGKPLDPKDLDGVRRVLARYGPDGEGYICKDNLGILYRAFHTTKESRRERQPHVSESGSVITWDGRLDNRKDLIERLTGELSPDSTDLEIVVAAYNRWGTDTFRELIGDWAFCAWNPADQSLVLAKDFVGTRHMYYSVEKDHVTWCTILDPLILFATHSLKLEEEYIAGWLSFFPATHLTPYVGIHAVPPSSFVRVSRGTKRVTKYWDFDPTKRICYRTDAAYEEHFRSVFEESVRRRLRSQKPVLAELSGGMDSSSIVCMADEIIAKRGAETPRLDTVSYYNDSEPNWNERPFFTKVEERRCRKGCHINVDTHTSYDFEFDQDWFAATPASANQSDQATNEFMACVASQGNRVVLSGVGGDEITGGVPTAIPELANLFARADLATLVHQLKVWALQKREPWAYLLFHTVREFVPLNIIGAPKYKQPAPWLSSGFVKRNQVALQGYRLRMNLFGTLPSLQDNMHTLSSLRRQLACFCPCPTLEKRYPYLDRDLVEFMYAIPREQVVRPHQRRSLMRRALVGIVPDTILNRRRKAFVVRAHMDAVAQRSAESINSTSEMICTAMGLVDGIAFARALKAIDNGEEIPIIPMMRTLALECWLNHLRQHNLVALPTLRLPSKYGPASPPQMQFWKFG